MIKYKTRAQKPKYLCITDGYTYSDFLSDQELEILAESDVTLDNTLFVPAYYKPLYNDIVLQQGVRQITPGVVGEQENIEHFIELLSGFDLSEVEKVLILGMRASFILNFVSDIPSTTKRYTEQIGEEFVVNFCGEKRTVLYLYHPRYIMNANRSLVAKHRKWLSGGSIQDDVHKRAVILEPKLAVQKVDEVITAYKEGRIPFVVFDTETTSLHPSSGHIFMYSFASGLDGIGYSVPLYLSDIPKNKKLQKVLDEYQPPELPFTISKQQTAELKRKMIELVSSVPIVGHNLKFDIMFLIKEALSLRKVKIFMDTLIHAHNFYAGSPGFKRLGLKDLCKQLFHVPDDWDEEIQRYLSALPRAESSYDKCPAYPMAKYAALDVYYNLLLARHLLSEHKYAKKNKTRHARIMQPIKIIESIIIPFAYAEYSGIAIEKDVNALINQCYEDEIKKYFDIIQNLPVIQQYKKETTIDFRALDVAALERIQKHSFGGSEEKMLAYIEVVEAKVKKIHAAKKKYDKGKITREQLDKVYFNPGSSSMLAEVLYGELYYNLPKKKKFMTDKGVPQSSKAALQFYYETINVDNIDPEDNPKNTPEVLVFLDSLMKLKKVMKLYTTYMGDLDKDTYYPEFKLTGTVTGRLSSGYHTIPGSSDIKRKYTSRWKSKGGLILYADLSQIELRIIASVAQEQAMIDSYCNNIDIHTKTASGIYGKAVEDVTPEERKSAKPVNFGITYQRGVEALADSLNIAKEEAQRMIDSLYAAYPRLKDYVDGQKEFVTQHGYVHSTMGRVIAIPDALSSYPKLKAEGERASVNYPIQSAASDVMQSGIGYLFWEMLRRNYLSLFIGNIHDSLTIDAYPGEIPALVNLVRYATEQYPRDKFPWISCPIVMDVSIGTTWGSVLDCEIEKSTDSEISFKTKGLKRDVEELFEVASRAYDVKMEILEETDAGSFPRTIFIRDDKKLSVKMTIKNK